MDIYKDSNVEIISEEDKVLLKILETSFTLKDFDAILKNFPRVKITDFMELKRLFDAPVDEFIEIGTLLPKMDVQISKDRMQANVLFYEDPKNFVANEEELNEKIGEVASSLGINFGMKRVLWTELEKKKHIIAEGQEAEHGEDAQVRYFENPVIKPKIETTGKANFSDMNFVFEIEKDAWLGEKIPASSGTPGRNILGGEIPAKAGKDLILKYNPNSVYESEEDGKTIIRAMFSGVLVDCNGMITIQNHLVIDGDIGVETGDIEFDGSITVKGTVLAGYSIRATGDISIEAYDGVSGADCIESVNGDVFIRGGVFGHDKTQIKAGRNVYLKHTNQAYIYAEEICIETYAIGSFLHARVVRLDEFKGRIIGGKTEVTNSIHTAMTGNSHERTTELIVHTVNKKEKMGEIRFKAGKIKELEEETATLEKKLLQLEPLLEQMNPQQMSAYENSQYQFELKRTAILQLNFEIQKALREINAKDSEFIEIKKEANAGTIIKIGKRSAMIKTTTSGIFKVENGELNV